MPDEATQTCRGCGLCCLHMSVPPYDEDECDLLKENLPAIYEELAAIKRTRKLQLRVVGTDFIPCGFLDLATRTCRHHAHAPDICHRFEAGGASCTRHRIDAGLPSLEERTTITPSLECASCGAVLCRQGVRVEPCQTCLDAAEAEGYEMGLDEGMAELDEEGEG
ncbi:MAG: YkgJ family cysteine cluster protein [Candidatus Atribacteria bacterium]|nr:YkgJ family cysteine cluster protein [Candidatus Atribacteria bacterium]